MNLFAEVERELSTSSHRLESVFGDPPACSCGGYDSRDESNPAEAWRIHLAGAALAIVKGHRCDSFLDEALNSGDGTYKP